MCDANILGAKASDLVCSAIPVELEIILRMCVQGIIEKENDNDYPRATPGLYFMKYSGAVGTR
jgi:hypothetical protein